jgi:hypothetical protein
MARNVHAIDERRYDTQRMLRREIRRSRNASGCFPNEVFTVNQQWSMDRICRRAIERSGGEIGVLRILCHGNASYIELGTGVQTPNDVWCFRLLRGHWVGRYPRIVLDACGVASATPVSCTVNNFPYRDRAALALLASACTPGTASPTSAGHALCQAIADAAGILVVASYDIQLGPTPRGLEGSIHHFRPVQYFRRDGVDPLTA